MNDIFDSSNVFAVNILGQACVQQLQYNLYYNNVNTTTTPAVDREREQYDQPSGLLWQSAAVFGNPDFVDPSSGNFELQPDSPAIDAARSEIGPLPAANAIYPTVNQRSRRQPSSASGPIPRRYPPLRNPDASILKADSAT